MRDRLGACVRLLFGALAQVVSTESMWAGGGLLRLLRGACALGTAGTRTRAVAVCLAASPVLPFALAGTVVAPILATAGAIYACAMLPLALAGGVGAAAQLLWLCRDGAAVAVLLMCRWAVGRAVPSLRGTASVLFVGLSGHLGLLPASAALFLCACAVLTGVSRRRNERGKQWYQ